MSLPDGWFDILKHRSTANKIAISVNCALATPGDLPILAAEVIIRKLAS